MVEVAAAWRCVLHAGDSHTPTTHFHAGFHPFKQLVYLAVGFFVQVLVSKKNHMTQMFCTKKVHAKVGCDAVVGALVLHECILTCDSSAFTEKLIFFFSGVSCLPLSRIKHNC